MPDLERILQATPGTLSQQWYEDGAAVDAGTVTIGITRADGTILVAAGTSTNGTGTSPRTYNVSAVQTALLDRLTVTWTSSSKGTLVSYVEVAGGYVFSLSELSALKPPNQTWTTAQLVAMRTTVEQAIEDEYGTALVPRYAYETFTGDGGNVLALRGPVRAIRSLSVNGTALTSTDLAALVIQDGFVSRGSWGSWTSAANIIAAYEYGLAYPPPRVKQAALRLARQWLVTGPVDDRALGAASPDGSFSFGLATPGRNGSIFGLPELDAVILSSPYRVGVA